MRLTPCLTRWFSPRPCPCPAMSAAESFLLPNSHCTCQSRRGRNSTGKLKVHCFNTQKHPPPIISRPAHALFAAYYYNLSVIKKLTFFWLNGPKSKPPHQLLEDLSLRGCLDINWITDQVWNRYGSKSFNCHMSEHDDYVNSIISCVRYPLSLSEIRTLTFHMAIPDTWKGGATLVTTWNRRSWM